MKCLKCQNQHSVIRKGHYLRKGHKKPIQRFYCKNCDLGFSTSTGTRTYRQHKRHINSKLTRLICSSVTQRRSALLLGCTRKTVARRMKWLAIWARVDHQQWISQLPKFSELQFDELETYVHSRLKPISVPLIVSGSSRIILGFGTACMPATGMLADKSRKKYGYRPDFRSTELAKMMHSVKHTIIENATFISDQCPRYPKIIKDVFPRASHIREPGRKPRIGGQGELKRIGFDPIFTLNHTFAMNRANISRLVRKTWSTSKREWALNDHIAIYINFHNRTLLENR